MESMSYLWAARVARASLPDLTQRRRDLVDRLPGAGEERELLVEELQDIDAELRRRHVRYEPVRDKPVRDEPVRY
jgi:hypothetical protein